MALEKKSGFLQILDGGGKPRMRTWDLVVFPLPKQPGFDESNIVSIDDSNLDLMGKLPIQIVAELRDKNRLKFPKRSRPEVETNRNKIYRLLKDVPENSKKDEIILKILEAPECRLENVLQVLEI